MRRTSGVRTGLLPLATRYAFSLVPLGFAVWLAHYAFHFFTGVLTIVPVTQSAVAEWGQPLLGKPAWRLSGLRSGVVYPMQLGFLALGWIGAAIVAVRLAQRTMPHRRGVPTGRGSCFTPFCSPRRCG